MSARPGPFPDSYWLIEGRLLAGEYPGHWQEDKAREKLKRLLEAGVRSVIDLTETTDPLVPYEELLREVARELDVEVRYQRLPIRDMGIPTSDRMIEILDRVRAELDAGCPVYFHCWGGIGRTGTVACCWLVEEDTTATLHSNISTCCAGGRRTATRIRRRRTNSATSCERGSRDPRDLTRPSPNVRGSPCGPSFAPRRTRRSSFTCS